MEAVHAALRLLYTLACLHGVLRLLAFTTPAEALPQAASAPSPAPIFRPAVAAKGNQNANVRLVPLRRRPARRPGGRSFYTARVLVGQPRPQPLHVALDTASGQVILPSAECTSPACLEHRKYRPEASALAVDINADGTLVEEGQRLVAEDATRDAITIGFSSLDLGDGSVAGHFLADAVCLQAEADAFANSTDPAAHPAVCAEVGLVAATEMTEMPFRAAPFDGTLGLGLHGLSIRKGFSFLEALAQEKGAEPTATPPQFALYHGRTFGEAAFGGYNPERLASPLQWAPVEQPGDGYWQVRILGIRIGNHTLSACQDITCRGIIDSCTSSLGVPTKMMPDFQAALGASTLAHAADTGCLGPDIHLNLAGGFDLTLKAKDYAQAGDDGKCSASVAPLDLPESFAGAFVLGEALLRRYYTVFEWKEGSQRIGFGLAAEVDEGGVEEAAVKVNEAAEDLEERVLMEQAASVGFQGEHDQDQMTLMMVQVLLIRVVAVLGMIAVGTQLLTARPLVAYIDKFLALRSLHLEVGKATVVLPSDEAPMAEECVICLGGYEDASPDCGGADCKRGLPRWRRLRCGHHFHEACILEWLRKSKQCPVCRRHLTDTSDGWPGHGSR